MFKISQDPVADYRVILADKWTYSEIPPRDCPGSGNHVKVDVDFNSRRRCGKVAGKTCLLLLSIENLGEGDLLLGWLRRATSPLSGCGTSRQGSEEKVSGVHDDVERQASTLGGEALMKG